MILLLSFWNFAGDGFWKLHHWWKSLIKCLDSRSMRRWWSAISSHRLNNVRTSIAHVRTKWTGFRIWGCPPWPSLRPELSLATKAIRLLVSALPKKSMSSAFGRSEDLRFVKVSSLLTFIMHYGQTSEPSFAISETSAGRNWNLQGTNNKCCRSNNLSLDISELESDSVHFTIHTI